MARTIDLALIHDRLANNSLSNHSFISSVAVIDPSVPDQAIASFSMTGQGQQGQSTAIRIQDDTYIVNLHLRDYGFQAGKTYVVGVSIFGGIPKISICNTEISK